MLLFAFAATAGIVAGACKQDDADESGASLAVKTSCDDYCDAVKKCNDNTDVSKCKTKCDNALSSCQADEQDQALDQLDLCSGESCDDILGCTIKAGATCFFGI